MRCLLIQCPQCAQMNYATGDICAVCGATLPPATELEALPQRQARPQWLAGLTLAGLFALVWLAYKPQIVNNLGRTEADSLTPTTPSRPVKQANNNRPQQALKVPYRVTETWTTASGGIGQCILIEPRYARPKWLRLLGQQLSESASASHFTQIEVFDNPQAAAIRAHRLYGGTPAEAALELKYHVAQYFKKDDPHRCALIAYFDGFGSVNQQTYRY